MVPDIALVADESPGYPIVCSTPVQGCGASYRNGQSIAYVGGTSASTPLTAGMIALWIQDARQRGLPRPGFVAPLLYSLASKGAFVDVASGGNAIFGGSCCSAGRGYDLATGLGSPMADQVAALLRG
jgi:subtilase family serine protease